MVCGFFLMAPNALSFGPLTAIAAVGFSVTVRLEEEYLLSKHGDALPGVPVRRAAVARHPARVAAVAERR